MVLRALCIMMVVEAVVVAAVPFLESIVSNPVVVPVIGSVLSAPKV